MRPSPRTSSARPARTGTRPASAKPTVTGAARELRTDLTASARASTPAQRVVVYLLACVAALFVTAAAVGDGATPHAEREPDRQVSVEPREAGATPRPVPVTRSMRRTDKPQRIVTGHRLRLAPKPTTPPPAAPAPVAYAVSGNRALGLRLMLEAGFAADQWPALEALWTRESQWNHLADNPTSSAYGIPQALPGSKMASAGSDWATNPATQIRWGLGYIRERYGSPANALAHSHAVGWY